MEEEQEKQETRIMVISHSIQVAEGLMEIARDFTDDDGKYVYSASGAYDGSIGTDRDKVIGTIREIWKGVGPDTGIIAVVDMGSGTQNYFSALHALGKEDGDNFHISKGHIVPAVAWGAANCHMGFSFKEICVKMDEASLSFPFAA